MSDKEKHPGGRPPAYKTAKKMQEVIDKYFDDCAGTVATNADGDIIVDKHGLPVILNQRPPTVTGLALALGFTSRQALLNYEAKDKFVDTIKIAKSRIEQYAEERLYDRDGVNGAKFNLANNFSGWSEKQQIDSNVNATNELEVRINVVE